MLKIKNLKMKKLIGKKRKREKSCFFPEKLFKILQNKNNKSLIHWDKEGKIIEIENEFKFSKHKEKFFKGQNYDSFIRQLNLYGFEKLINIKNSDKERFILDNFTKNASLDDIRKIKRKKTNKKIEIKVIDNNTKENNEKINEILNQIEKEKDDYVIIQKYKSIINDESINLNNNFIINIMKYITTKKEELKEKTNKIKEEIKKIKFKSIASNFDLNQNKIELDVNKANIYESKILFNNKNNINEFEFDKPVNLLNKSFNKELKKEDPNNSFNKYILNNFNNKDVLKNSLFSNLSETLEAFKKNEESEINFL